MQNRKKIIRAVLAVLLAMPAAAWAQGSSLNTFSPYTFYGLGDFSIQGPTFLRSMGGAGVGFRDYRKVNYLNPASFSVLARKSFLFNVDLQGNNSYLKTANAKTSHNSFNVRDIALAMPLGTSIGLGISVTPLSSVGYRVDMNETDPYILASGMDIVYSYIGEGNVTQAKMGLGLQVFKRLALGVDLVYYHGSLNRSYTTTIRALLDDSKYIGVAGLTTEEISRMNVNFGMQLDLISGSKRALTLGATYTPRVNLRPSTTDQIFPNNFEPDTIRYVSGKKDFALPGTLTVGLFYQTMKFGAGFDYSLQRWNGVNAPDPLNGVDFRSNHYFKLGAQYTPDPMSVRHFLARWTYRAGIRYNDYYMQFGGKKINDLAFTVGIGIPITKNMWISSINLGAEFGRRGNTQSVTLPNHKQFQMIRENYVRFSIGLSLFGTDDWFKRFKYQ